MTKEQLKKVLVFGLFACAWVAALVLGINLPQPPTVGEQLGALAESRSIVGELSGDIKVEDNLTVGGALEVAGASAFGGNIVIEGATADNYETTVTAIDPTADRTITIGDDTGSVMLTSTPGVFVVGTNVITGTAAIAHGLTTPQTVQCTLMQDAEANAATCSATISGGTVTIKTWKADGVTPGSVGKIVSWFVGGQQ